MSKLSKFLRSDGGKLLTGAAVAYAKKQSSDVRKVGPIVDILVGAATQEKPAGVLADTMYKKQTGVNIMAEQPQITPVKSGIETSTFKIMTIAALITPLIPTLQTLSEKWIGTLPPNSWLAYVVPGLLAAVFGFFRYLTTNGERQATAQVATAQAATAIAQAIPPAAPTTQVAISEAKTVEDDYEPVAG